MFGKKNEKWVLQKDNNLKHHDCLQYHMKNGRRHWDSGIFANFPDASPIENV